MDSGFLSFLIVAAPPVLLLSLGGLGVFLWSLRVERKARQQSEPDQAPGDDDRQHRRGRKRHSKSRSGNTRKR